MYELRKHKDDNARYEAAICHEIDIWVYTDNAYTKEQGQELKRAYMRDKKLPEYILAHIDWPEQVIDSEQLRAN